jgi:hypothetical protein
MTYEELCTSDIELDDLCPDCRKAFCNYEDIPHCGFVCCANYKGQPHDRPLLPGEWTPAPRGWRYI